MSPILFRLGSLSTYTYGFFLVLGFVVGLIVTVLKTQKEGVLFEHVVGLFFYTVLSAILGPHLSFILVNVDLCRQNPLQMFKIFLLYATIRFLVEMVRGDPQGSLFYGLLSTSQGIGIFLGILSLFMLFYLKKEHRG
jgi:prolipoprotein diacylglyceryltransferase